LAARTPDLHAVIRKDKAPTEITGQGLGIDGGWQLPASNE
jgi:hypothetical protein